MPSTACRCSFLPLSICAAVTVGGAAAYSIYRLRRKIRLGAAVWSKTWFTEFSSMWPGQAFSLRVEKELYEGKSEFQTIQVFDCGSVWGKVLVLDGVIQATEKDECAYQEMMAHVPTVSHPNPKKVLVIGGGDGGILRELARHRSIEEMHICEIDGEVIEVSKKYLPSLARGFDDPRVHVHIQDGFEYLMNHKKEFDVIIVDSSDPVGPAETLFKEGFYKVAFEALADTGILCCQAECMWLHADVIKRVKEFTSRVFPVVEYGAISVPSYPCGSIGMLCCSKDIRYHCSSPTRSADEELLKNLFYYNPEIHRGSFMLPTFVKQIIES